MLRIPKNKFAITYLSFVGGFVMIFLAQFVFAVTLTTDAPLTEVANQTMPTIHSLDVAGGANAADGNGVSIDNDGKFDIKTRTLAGSYNNPSYGLNISSTLGGFHVTAPNNPVAGINSMAYTKGGPNAYGRVGVEGKVLSDTKGILGYLTFMAPGNYEEYEPITATVPDAITPHAFYTIDDTYLGDTVNINGILKGFLGDLTIAANSHIAGNVNINGNLDTDVLNFSNTTNLDNRFNVNTYQNNSNIILQNSAPNSSATYLPNTIIPDSKSCAADEYLVGCTGYIEGANSYAPYRGAKMTSTTPKGGECTAYAMKPPLLQNNSQVFFVHAIAYCFKPN